MKYYEPYIPCEHMPVVQAIKANWRRIRGECDSMFHRTSLDLKPNWELEKNRNRLPTEDNETMYRGENYSAHIRIVEELLVPKEIEVTSTANSIHWRNVKAEMNPTIMGILQPHIDAGNVGNIGFNRLMPGARIAPHYGVSTKYFRVHLGLHVDSLAQFFIEGGPPYTWEEGKIMAFADGHWLHWVEHNGTKQRTIMAVDFKKEMLGPEVMALIPDKPI